MLLRKFWINEISHSLVSLSFESKNPELIENRLSVKETTFPQNPSNEHPLRHVINIGLFNDNELFQIYAIIKKHLEG